MAKYKCIICGEIYDEEKEKIKFEDLPGDWTCPKCGVPKSMFKKTEEEIVEKEENKFKNAIYIAKDNVAIEKDDSKCIDCGLCKTTCKEREGIEDICNGRACVNCGQCIQVCPTGALSPRNDIDNLRKMLGSDKICIAYTSPSVRVALGEEFGMESGSFVQGKMISALRKIGFKYVLDVTFGADLTIVEEANELVDRIKNNKKLPMFTSCCPSWIKYAEQYYPELLDNISTCKSPIGMQGIIVKEYFVNKYNLDINKVYTVAITPCTSKKYEIRREEIKGTDLVITTKELSNFLKEEKIDFKNLENSEYDKLMGEGTGAGMIFGNTGGVMEAALRTAYNIMTGEELSKDDIKFSEVRGIDNLREATIEINDQKLNVAIIHQMSKAKEILEDVKNNKSKYHYIEIMNCLGGCVGGGGQPKTLINNEISVKQDRINSLYKKDDLILLRSSHQNPEVVKLYNELLKEPLSDKSEELLHTKYEDKSKIIVGK